MVETQEVLVPSWKPGEGRWLGTIGSVLLGIENEQDQLVYAGHVGTLPPS